MKNKKGLDKVREDTQERLRRDKIKNKWKYCKATNSEQYIIHLCSSGDID
jgi:hypothetical protein